MKKKEELKENEAVVEEQPVQEETPAPVEEPPVVPPEKFEYSDEILQQIEDNRKAFYTGYRRGSIFKWVVAFLSIGLLVFAFIGIPNMVSDNNVLKLSLMVSLGLISLVSMILYTTLSKFFLNKKARKYFGDYYNDVTRYVMSSEDFKDVTCDAQLKLPREEFDENMLYKDIDMVGSRGLTNLKYKGLEMKVCDLAAQIKIDRRPKPVFVGKYVVAPCKFDDEPILIYVKGDEKRSLPPTNTENFKLVVDDAKIAVYSNNPNWSKFLTAKLRNKLLQINSGHSLVDIAITFKANKMLVCLGYDDDIMVLPLEKPFNPKPTEEYKVEFNKLAKIIEELNK